MSSTDTIFLQPRPYARLAGMLLVVPLLPGPKPLKPLPAELWAEIFTHALEDGSSAVTQRTSTVGDVCKSFHEIMQPLLYNSVVFTRLQQFEKFFKRLHNADQKWDSIRRIPFSTPGRWVQNVDLSDLPFEGQAQAMHLDGMLSQLFQLTPFLSSFMINPAFLLSKRALASLAQRESSSNIRRLVGLSYLPPPTSAADEDPFVQLLRSCPNIEEFIIVGQGLDPTELEFNFSGSMDLPSLIAFKPLDLPKLRLISILSMHSSPLMQALLNSPLPSLRKLELTPYDDIPYPASLSTEFIIAHGKSLHSLQLLTPKSWPTRLRPSPERLLEYCPNLNHLSLETPLPDLRLTDAHQLRILSIARPTPDFWRVLEERLPFLPNLAVVRTRDVRWLRKGISSMAQGAGVQGEMREWKRRLERRNIQLLDTDWRRCE
ncbi:hypothetical protein CPB83DRAFT_780161 [Crepidotus variabilis]|uniref:F-box domain-containing protein n=1 Tax=Crepidotus variabilis TaxID=179855 RepID=A0A9P6JVV0_9AGAR|nr:hypothetical protein CPB83DRAFT_780161 [Crepidotus variabilis]